MHAVDWFFRNPKTGEVVIARRPNLPLLIFLVASAVRIVRHPHGTAGAIVNGIGTIALTWWAADELFRGECPFRRVVGAVVLVGIVAGIVIR